MNKKDLISFETEIATLFNAGKIKAPVHLSNGNEKEVIEIFSRISYDDHIFSTWRSHYHALCHGISPEWIKNDENLTSFSSHAFYDGKLMRRLFDECLKSEARELAKNGLQPATTIMDIPLRDGQKCFRMGHPAFRTQPINNS